MLYYQHVPNCSLCHVQTVLKISWKSVHAFSREHRDRQTAKPTKMKHSLRNGNVLQYDHKYQLFLLILNALPLCIYDQLQLRILSWHYACAQTHPVWMIIDAGDKYPAIRKCCYEPFPTPWPHLSGFLSGQDIQATTNTLTHAPLGFYE